MKIAIARDGSVISAHFGHCEGFEIVDIDNGKVSQRKFIANPGHQPGFLPNYLKDLRVETVITGGIGENAKQLFNERNIKVFSGVTGNIDDIIEQVLKGQLDAPGSTCSHHHECK